MTEKNATESHRAFFAVLAVLLGLGLFSLFAQWPRNVAPADVPAGEFSATRALTSLEGLLDRAGGPHPVGTAANARVHEGVIEELEAAGWQVERQRGIGCRSFRTCAAVENLIARLPGQGSGPAVLVACHTDSVPAGPGAGDDGAGMAVMLEMARNLAAGPAPERPIWLLFDEGEEMGLLGAELFVNEMEPGSVGAVVNLEARGTEGPVWMFETSDGGGDLVAAYGRSVARPSTSSIAYSVYKRMPNDTDLTVFRQAGLAGVGLAFIDGGARYHTPRDDLEHLSSATVQRMGESASQLVWELAAQELPLEESEAVFFDLASMATVSWPASLTLPATLVALLLIAYVGRREAPVRELVTGLSAWLSSVFGALAGGAGVYFLLTIAGALPTPFPENMPWATAAAAAAGAFGAASNSRLFWLSPSGRLLSGLLGFGLIALLCSVLEPAASYPFLLAALFGGAAAALGSVSAGGIKPPILLAAGLLASLVLVLTLVPLVRMLPVGLGPLGLVGSALLSGLIVIPILPLLPLAPRFPKPLLVSGLAAIALLVVVTSFQPSLSVDNPQAVTVLSRIEIDAETGERSSRAFVLSSGPMPAELVDAAGPFEDHALGRGMRPSIAITDPGHQPVEVRVLARGEDTLRLHLRSPQEAWALLLQAPDDTEIIGVTWPGLEARTSPEGVPWLRLQAVPPEGLEIELRGALEGSLRIIDRGLGLPADAAHLALARPAWATPIGPGDRSEVVSWVDLATLVPEPVAAEEPLEDELAEAEPSPPAEDI